MNVDAKSESIDETMVSTDVSPSANPDSRFSRNIERAASFVVVEQLR